LSSEQLIEGIMQSTLVVSRTMRQRLCHAPADANMLQMHALMFIREQKGMTMKEFAKCLKITSPSATSFVNRLVKLNWVERDADPANRKLVRLKVSSKGEALLRSEWKRRTDELQQILSLLSLGDQKELARILSFLASSLQKLPS
jgi:DNA-binding MarR family transcriptional regulator